MVSENNPPQTSEGAPGNGAPGGGEALTAEELQARLEEAERERSQYKAIAQRAQADLVNYRQRVERERQDQHLAMVERTISKLLPIVDDLQLALKHAGEGRGTEGNGVDAAWVEGIRMIERRLLSLLESEGVTPIAAEGKAFDPWQHEALFSVDDASKEPGTVVMVIRQGYKVQDRVLRAVQVAISQAGQQDTAQQRQPQAKEAGTTEEREDTNG